MNSKKAILALQDGTIFEGNSIGADGLCNGEIVFNTSMSGYQEILTDPSYFKQIVTLTYPHIGNTGTNNEDKESLKVWPSGFVIRDNSIIQSNWRNEESLTDFLKKNNIPGISDIDTRKVTRIIREKGAQSAAIFSGEEYVIKEVIKHATNFPGLTGMDLAKEVSTKDIYDWKETIWNEESETTKYKVVALDFGIKRNILRLLVKNRCEVKVLPAQSSLEEILEHKPDGVFLSNGPGDPEPCTYAIEVIKKISSRAIPMFGICLGHQLMALAFGAKTVKMKFGHHGANHPVKELESGKVFVTSQNHGFMVEEDSLPENISITHKSLFDNSIQGLEYKDIFAFSFQGHPEASPGPHDLDILFKKFIHNMEEVSAEKI
tara:strand:- start:87405 stop:88532 length:1128 start_codon:yes stop_codon:yes gene_type:complete